MTNIKQIMYKFQIHVSFDVGRLKKRGQHHAKGWPMDNWGLLCPDHLFWLLLNSAHRDVSKIESDWVVDQSLTFVYLVRMVLISNKVDLERSRCISMDCFVYNIKKPTPQRSCVYSKRGWYRPVLIGQKRDRERERETESKMLEDLFGSRISTWEEEWISNKRP